MSVFSRWRRQENYLRTLTANRIQSTLLIIRVQIPYRLAHHQRQFHLIVQANSLGEQNGTLARQKNRRRRLQEEERLLRLGIVEFCNVVAAGEAFVSGDDAVQGPSEHSRIVAADANHLSAIGSY